MSAMPDLEWGYLDKRDCVLRYLAGPHLYGIDDPLPEMREEIAVVIEPPEFVIGRYEFRPRTFDSNGLRLTELSLRQFIRRVLDGNLTTMLPLLAPDAAVVYRSEVGRGLFTDRTELLGSNLPRSLVAYLRARRNQLAEGGISPGAYDTELASLLLRIGHQGIEALNEQRVTLPVAEPLLGRLRQVRAGEAHVDDILHEADELIGQLEVAPRHMRDPPVDVEYEQWLIHVYREHWDQTWKPVVLE
jgi:hypothetical protein